MESLEFKYEIIKKAQISLGKMIALFDKQKKKHSTAPSDELFEIVLGLRDSMIQRFEYNVDLLWKYLKLYLEVSMKFPVSISAPKGVVREAVKAKLITEQQAEAFIEMLDNRNLTSHMYNNDVSEQIAAAIPGCYLFMQEIMKKTRP